MPKVKLNHTCNAKGCQGHAGDVIDVSEKDAGWLLARGGGTRVKEAAPEPVSKRKDKKREADPGDGGASSAEDDSQADPGDGGKAKAGGKKS